MFRFFVRRLFYFLPVLVIISLLSFIISRMAPGDPADRMVQVQTGAGSHMLTEQRLIQKEEWRKKLGLDLPLFYVTLQALSEPDWLGKIYPEQKRYATERLISRYGNPDAVRNWQQSLLELNKTLAITGMNLNNDSLNIPVKDAISGIKLELSRLDFLTDEQPVQNSLAHIQNLARSHGTLSPLLASLEHAVETCRQMQITATPWLNFIPTLRFHPDNQYHRWIFGDGNWLTGEGPVFSKGIIRGDFGTSYQTGLPVKTELFKAMRWSLLLAVLTLLLSYLVSIPVGLMAAFRPGGRFDLISGSILFFQFSLPAFWVATMLLLVFANPDALRWFPASGVMPVTGYPEKAGLAEKISLTLPYLVLPLICFSYAFIAYVGRTLRASVISEMKNDYIRTARAKGLGNWQVLFRHAFRNSTLPLITTFAGAFPMVIGGSVIIETIFSIPGMGMETVHAIQHQNYPVVVAIFTLTGVLTLTGYLAGDLLYSKADPRITYQSARL